MTMYGKLCMQTAEMKSNEDSRMTCTVMCTITVFPPFIHWGPTNFRPLSQIQIQREGVNIFFLRRAGFLVIKCFVYSDRLSVQECLNHPWLNTEELFQRSPVRKSRRSYGSEQKQKRKKLKKLQQQNGIADGELHNE